MKKFLSLLLALTMLLTLCGAASAEAGVFTGVGDSDIGGKGAIEVAVTVDENGAVTAIEVTKNGDTAGISDPAVAQIPGLIVEQQTANVDAVAGPDGGRPVHTGWQGRYTDSRGSRGVRGLPSWRRRLRGGLRRS